MRFGAKIAASTVAMFVMMYFNSYRLDHVFYSETGTFMALYMGAVMAVIMLLFMPGMYRNRVANGAILIAAVAVFAGSLWLLRSQNTVQDVSWMKAMIPHHSIAILTSERAEISDPRVADLAERIFEAQRIEIAEMKALFAVLPDGPPATPEVDGE
jgi:hypothetical protein